MRNDEGSTRGRIIDAVSISERPASVEARGPRALGGRFDNRLKNTHIATLVERHSRFTMLVKVDGKNTEAVVSALIKQVQRLPMN